MAVKRKRLPKLPTEIWSPLGPVPVVKVDTLDEPEGVESAGDVNFYTRTIRIRKDTSPATQHVTLEHERIHLILFDAGLKLPEELEETICDVIATAKVAEMTAQLSKEK